MGNCKSFFNPSSPTSSLPTEPVLSTERRELITKAALCFLSAGDVEWLLGETETMGSEGLTQREKEGFRDRLKEYLKRTEREERVFVVECSFQME